MRELADSRREAAKIHPGPQGYRALQAIPHKRHARPDREEITGLDAEHRPAGDDFLDAKNAVDQGESLFDVAVDGQLHFDGFELFSGRLQQHGRPERRARRKVLAEQVVGGQAFASVDIARSDIDQECDPSDMVPGLRARDSSARFADDDGETGIGIDLL